MLSIYIGQPCPASAANNLTKAPRDAPRITHPQSDRVLTNVPTSVLTNIQANGYVRTI